MIRHGVVRLLSAVLVAAGATACSSTEDTVVVLSSWSDHEQDVFVNHVLAEFTRQTGIEVEFQRSTRALDQELRKELETGTQPNIAILPGPGQLATFAAQGALQPLDDTLRGAGQFGPLWRSIDAGVQPAGGAPHRYALPFVVSLKSAIWYSPRAMRGLFGQDWRPPTTWDELDNLTRLIAAKGETPWCMGLESTPVSGWPGTDWIENLLLRQAGPEVYEQWANGALSWQSPEIVNALSTWGEILSRDDAVHGGTETALLTNFAEAGKPLFTAEPGCYLYHTAYIDNAKGQLEPGVDYDFFPFPPMAGQDPTYEVSGDFAVMFRRSPAADELMRFLASDEGQVIWPAIPNAAKFSPNRAIGPNRYPDEDPTRKRVAQILTQSDAVCFDASDLMPPGMSGAFNQAVLTFVSDPDPTKLPGLLGNLEKVRSAAYEGDTRKFRCGQA